MEIEIRYTIGDKQIACRKVMSDQAFVSLQDPYSHVGRLLAHLVDDTIPAVCKAIDEEIIKDAMEALAKRLNLA